MSMPARVERKAQTQAETGAPPHEPIDPMRQQRANASGAVFDAKGFDGHESVHFWHDKASGLRAIIAVHDTRLGPALGGCRMWPYASEAEAITDVLRLSRGMTYKHAITRLPNGGGKAVIIGDPAHDKSQALLLAFGRCIDALGGRYITAEDVGTTVADMTTMRRETDHVAGIAAEAGGSGDPSPVTAYGVFCGLRAAVAFALGRNDLNGLRVAVQGLGHVGRALCGYLRDAGARLIVADINDDAVAEARETLGAAITAPETIYDVKADVFAPCALGAVLNAQTIPRLRARVVAGAANNQLATEADAERLAQRGILYAPDFVINAGGIINISYERSGYDRARALKHTEQIHDTVTEIFARATREGRNTAAVADAIAEERLAAA